MSESTSQALVASAVGFLELRPAADPLFLLKHGFLSGYTGTTRRDYESDIDIYLRWCASVGLDPLLAERPHLQFFLRYLQGTGWASSTVGRRFGTVACMYKYAAGEELVPRDPTLRITRPRVQYDEQRCTFLTALEFGRFTAAAAESTVMGNALVFLLGVNALRIAEACSLNIEGMTVERGYDVINFVGKGGDTYAQPLSIPATRAIKKAIGTRTEGPILLNKWGNRMTRANATLLIRQIAESAKVRTDISPHSLRRSFATTAANVGIPVQDIQGTLRHRQINTTMRYIKRSSAAHDSNATHRMASYLAGMAS